MKQFFLLTITLFTLFRLQAQDTDSTVKQRPRLKLSVNYHSNLNYYGRTDSLRSSGIFPMAELWFSERFYVNATPVFVNNAVQKMDYAGTVATAGYQYLTDKWFTHLYVTKPFYEESSQLVQSALKAQSGISISSLNKVMNLTVGGDLKLSDKVDFGATAGLDRTVRLEKRGYVLVINPSVYAYAGTQNFTRTYNRKKSGFLLFPGNQQQVTETSQEFNILAYEASVPLILVRNNWMLIATPSYILPRNLVTVSGRPDLSEQGKNTFYATLAIKYTF